MKILAITASYPPYHFGGYEIRCKNILDELARRGHEILVLTSIKETKSESQPQTAYGILRRLHISLKADSFIAKLTLRRSTYHLGMVLVFARELLLDLLDVKFIDRQIQHFQPDVIYLAHMFILSRALMPYLSACSVPVVYDEGGMGLIDSWADKGIWYKFVEEYISPYSIINAIKSLLIEFVRRVSAGRMKPRWAWPARMHIFFNSELGRRNAIAAGVPVNGAEVVHSGIDLSRFVYRPKIKLGSPLTCIVPGRIEPHKGQIDAVRLLAKLREQDIDAKLLLVGENWINSYYLEIKNEIETLQLGDHIEFLPMVSHDHVVELYHQADICFFPSYQRAGFSRVPLEAMACGCIVISYGNEGSDEIMLDGEDGFLVSPQDCQGMVKIITSLMANSLMVRSILEAARKKIKDDFSMEAYVDRVEELLENTARVHRDI